VLYLGCLVLAATTFLTPPASGPAALIGTFIMNEAEDGVEIGDSFEVWDFLCRFEPMPPDIEELLGPSCSMTAVSFATRQGETRLSTWRHISGEVSPVATGVFRVQFDGRLGSCSGLDVFIRLDGTLPTGVEAIEGSMQVGSRCQSRRVFTLDTKSRSRRVAPLHNSAYN